MSQKVDKEVNFKQPAETSRQELATKKARQTAPDIPEDEVNQHDSNYPVDFVDHEEIVTDGYEDKSDGELESSATTDDGVETSSTSESDTSVQTSESEEGEISDGSPHSSDVDVTYTLNSDYSDVVHSNESESEIENEIIDEDLSDNVEEGIEELTSSCVESYYGATKKSEFDPPINSKLAQTLVTWCKEIPTRDNMKEIFKNCSNPSNISQPLDVKINGPIYTRLNTQVRENDKRLRAHAIYMIKALGSLSHLWEILMQSEVVAKRKGKPQPQFQTDKHLFSCIDMADLLVTALKALGLGISLNFQRRKNNIKPFLDRRYQVLCSAKNEVTNNLLGDNIEQKVSEIYKVSQTTRQTSRAFRPFRPFDNQQRRPFSGKMTKTKIVLEHEDLAEVDLFQEAGDLLHLAPLEGQVMREDHSQVIGLPEEHIIIRVLTNDPISGDLTGGEASWRSAPGVLQLLEERNV